jgi:hypothetical protein
MSFVFVTETGKHKSIEATATGEQTSVHDSDRFSLIAPAIKIIPIKSSHILFVRFFVVVFRLENDNHNERYNREVDEDVIC